MSFLSLSVPPNSAQPKPPESAPPCLALCLGVALGSHRYDTGLPRRVVRWVPCELLVSVPGTRTA